MHTRCPYHYDCRQCLRYYTGDCPFLEKREEPEKRIELNEVDLQLVALLKMTPIEKLKKLSEFAKEKYVQKFCYFLNVYQPKLFSQSECRWISHFQGPYSYSVKGSYRKIKKMIMGGKLSGIAKERIRNKQVVEERVLRRVLERVSISGWSPFSIIEEAISLWVPHPFGLREDEKNGHVSD